MDAGFEAVQLARALLREPDLVNRWRDEGGDSLCVTAIAALRTFTTQREPGAFIDLPTSLKTTKSWHRLAR